MLACPHQEIVPGVLIKGQHPRPVKLFRHLPVPVDGIKAVLRADMEYAVRSAEYLGYMPSVRREIAVRDHTVIHHPVNHITCRSNDLTAIADYRLDVGLVDGDE